MRIQNGFDARFTSTISFDCDGTVFLHVASESTTHGLESVVSFVGMISGQLFKFVEQVGLFVRLIRGNYLVDIDRFGESTPKEDGGGPITRKNYVRSVFRVAKLRKGGTYQSH